MPEKLFGLILAGGLGTRLHPLTLHIPKCLLEINGRAFLDFQLELLAKNNVTDIAISTGYLGEKIDDYLKSHSTHGVYVKTVREGEQLGTGGAIINALPLLPEEFFVIYGDSYLLQPILPVFQAFKKSGRLALMSVIRQEGGALENNCAVKNGFVRGYAKGMPRGAFSHMDYGLLFFKKKALLKYEKANFSTDTIFSDLIQEGQLAAFETASPYYEIGSKEGLRNFKEHITSNNVR